MSSRLMKIATVLIALTLAAGCGGSSDESASTTAPKATDCTNPPLKKAGVLTVATGDPAFEPWVVDDDPSNGKGFEAAVVAAVAKQMGITKVTWTRTGFDAAIAPGKKDFDFNVQQYSITPERKEVVDFSRSYYTVEQALVAAKDNEISKARSLADLKDARLGAALGSTSLDYIENVIKPNTQVQVFDDNAAAKAAFDAGQVDGLVFDLPTAYYVTAVEIENADIVGVLPTVGDAEQLGFLFEKGSPLVSCVDNALDALDKDGTLASLQTEWLARGGDIPTLSE